MRLIVLDFETKDPYIDLGLGGGWVYALHNKNHLFEVTGYGLQWILEEHDGTKVLLPPEYVTLMDWQITPNTLYLKRELEKAEGIIMHNAQYDLGCLKVLGIDIKGLKVYDTKIIAHLYNNTLMSYSLDNLSKKYLATDLGKNKDVLIDSAINNHLCDHLLPKNKDFDVARFRKKVEKWCYQNMDIIQEKDFEAMAKYATQDVIATANLFLQLCE
jgi:DNA polymerase I-like protein with 3'-5' exonuclease and polymerase domains